jgi:DNA-binding transcriptional regulator YhcF (GntR family)
MSNVIPMLKASVSVRPEKIFLLDQVVQKFGVLPAVITGELYFWIAKGEPFWRVVSDYETWFKVNEKTIRRNIKSLDDAQFFKMTRTRMKSGSYGANLFKKSNSSNSKALFNLYVSLFNNGFDSGDFGEFVPDEPEYKESPKFQMLFLRTIEQVEDLKAAYVLDRLCWAFSSKGESTRGFYSKSHFAKWANLDRNTAKRKLAYLEVNGFLETKEKGEMLFITIDELSEAYCRFSDYQEEKYESRKCGIMEKLS